MDFRLTEEQELIRRNIREFAEKNIDPIAAEIDENSRHPVELFRKLGAGGWMGIPLPAEYGGAGADFMTHAIVVEEIARSCSSTGFTVSFHAGIIGTSLALFGSEEQKRKYLVPLAKGEHMGAFMLTEPQAGTDVMAIGTTAVRDGDDYVIDGTKTFVSNGPLADTYILFCWTDRSAGRKGMSAFIVPKGTPGLEPGKHFDKMGLRSSQTSEVVFRKCRVPAENLLKQEGAGFSIAMTGFDHGRIGIAAQAVGMLQAALDESIRYSKERVQFGNPICPPTGDCLDDRRHGDGPFRRPVSRLPRRLAEGPGTALRQGGLDGQALRDGKGDAAHRQGRPDPRRVWLYQGRESGAADARRQDRRGLRRHIGSPANGHIRKRSAIGRERRKCHATAA